MASVDEEEEQMGLWPIRQIYIAFLSAVRPLMAIYTLHDCPRLSESMDLDSRNLGRAQVTGRGTNVFQERQSNPILWTLSLLI